MSLGTILLIILVIALLGGFSGLGGGPFYGTGYYGGGGLGLILVVVLILVCSASFELPGQCPRLKLVVPAQKPIRFGNRFADDDRDWRFLISRIEHCLAISLQAELLRRLAPRPDRRRQSASESPRSRSGAVPSTARLHPPSRSEDTNGHPCCFLTNATSRPTFRSRRKSLVSESTRSAKVRLQPLGALPLLDGEECRKVAA